MLGEALATEVWVPHMASYIFTPQERETTYFWAFTEKTNHHNKNSNAEVTISQTSQTLGWFTIHHRWLLSLFIMGFIQESLSL